MHIPELIPCITQPVPESVYQLCSASSLSMVILNICNKFSNRNCMEVLVHIFFLTFRINKIFPAEDQVSACNGIPDLRLWPTSSSYVNSEVNNYVIL